MPHALNMVPKGLTPSTHGDHNAYPPLPQSLAVHMLYLYGAQGSRAQGLATTTTRRLPPELRPSLGTTAQQYLTMLASLDQWLTKDRGTRP